MKLPFSTQDFLDIFRQYNHSVWPVQVLLILVALLSIYMAIRNHPSSSITISSILAFFWFWMGVVYHLIYFSVINPVAYLFGLIFIIQGLLFLYEGLIKKTLFFHFEYDGYGILGGAIILYALLIYPVIGFYGGHIYPNSPTFGLPCPTTIFTFGILLWADKKVPLYILLIPFIWSIIGFTAAIKLGMAEDTSLIIVSVLASILIIRRRKRPITRIQKL